MTKLKPIQRNILATTIVVVVIVAILGLSLSSGSNKPVKTSTTTTTLKKKTGTTLSAAQTASISVARAAVELDRGSATTTAANVLAASRPDRPTLVIVKNIGEITGFPRVAALEWKLGGAPITICVIVPATKKDLPTNIGALLVRCPLSTH